MMVYDQDKYTTCSYVIDIIGSVGSHGTASVSIFPFAEASSQRKGVDTYKCKIRVSLYTQTAGPNTMKFRMEIASILDYAQTTFI